MFREPFEEIERYFHHWFAPFEIVERNARIPRVNLYSDNGNLIAEFELPGVEKKDIELNISPWEIEVKVERKEEVEIKRKAAYRYEAKARKFYRRISLPEEVVPEKATAELKEGILSVKMPKAKVKFEKKKKIPIK